LQRLNNIFILPGAMSGAGTGYRSEAINSLSIFSGVHVS